MCNILRKWSQEETFNLISFYRELRVLWDPQNRDYGLKSKRAEAISALAEKFDTTDSEINRKLHNLRCQFRGEIRNYNKRVKNDSKFTRDDPKDNGVSNWQFFDLMKDVMGYSEKKDSFFDSEELRRASQTMHGIQFDDLLSTGNEYRYNNAGSTTRTSSQNLSELLNSDGYRIPKRRKSQQSENNSVNVGLNIQPNDDKQLFGDYVANELRHMTNESQRIAKLRITRVLLEMAEAESSAHRYG